MHFSTHHLGAVSNPPLEDATPGTEQIDLVCEEALMREWVGKYEGDLMGSMALYLQRFVVQL